MKDSIILDTLAFHLNKILPRISERFCGSSGQHLNTNICYQKEEINLFLFARVFCSEETRAMLLSFRLLTPHRGVETSGLHNGVRVANSR